MEWVCAVCSWRPVILGSNFLQIHFSCHEAYMVISQCASWKCIPVSQQKLGECNCLKITEVLKEAFTSSCKRSTQKALWWIFCGLETQWQVYHNLETTNTSSACQLKTSFEQLSSTGPHVNFMENQERAFARVWCPTWLRIDRETSSNSLIVKGWWCMQLRSFCDQAVQLTPISSSGLKILHQRWGQRRVSTA